ncbi:MAG: polyhydroxyalkanoic acid system family protein [Betaproteobacteria bacterium]
MSEILIIPKHKLSAKKARAAAEHVAADLQKEFNLDYEWDEDGVLNFERSGLYGNLVLTKGEVRVHVTLGFLLRPFRTSLEREIHDYFDQRFA